jgi:hypothetical protein
MTLRDIINKEFEVINEEQKSTKKVINIFYKLNINLIKPQKEEKTQDNNQNQQQPQQQELAQQQPTDQGQPQQTTPQPDMASQSQQPTAQGGGISLSDNEINALASVQTEETENNAMDIKDDNNIVRKIEGQVELKQEKVDEIQTFQDIIEYLTKEQVEGVSVFDEFTSEVINTIFSPQAAQISQMVDKKSSIFVDIQYGFAKDDNVGVRIKKVANSDTVSNVMIIDGEIINAPFNLMKVNERIIDYRNNLISKKE